MDRFRFLISVVAISVRERDLVGPGACAQVDWEVDSDFTWANIHAPLEDY